MYATELSGTTVYGYVVKIFPKIISHVLLQLRLILCISFLTKQPPPEYTRPRNGRVPEPDQKCTSHRSNFLSGWQGEASTNYRKANYSLKMHLNFLEQISFLTLCLSFLPFWQFAIESISQTQTEASNSTSHTSSFSSKIRFLQNVQYRHET